MRYARVVPDVKSRALEGTFDYAVPDDLAAEALVGSTVLVPLSGRQVVGYVMGLADAPSDGVDPSRVLGVSQVLAPSAFDEAAARVAIWMATEYACPLCEAVRPFLAPGQRVRVTRDSDTSPWRLVNERAGSVDVRWVTLTDAAADFTPARRASRQRAVLKALEAGPQRLAELSATIPSASGAVRALAARGVVTVEERRLVRGGDLTSLSSAAAPRPASLTAGQLEAIESIRSARASASGEVVLIDGVTGSGKTEVYLNAIEEARSEGAGALVLVPEISLTAQTVGRFRSRFGDDVAVLHSRLSTGERYDQWDLLRQGRAHVAVGARSALFAPVANLGLIIIDEEHEPSYKQDSAPRYHAREVACRMARERGCAAVLGSATPSLESLSRARSGGFSGVRWTRVRMTERPGAATLPEVRVVDMTDQFAAGNRSIFSSPLRSGLEEVCEHGEKAVLMLNRRGFASFLMCRECGCVPSCPHCSTALTYHERTHSLMCHTCGRSWPTRAFPDPSTSCPNCGSRYLAQFGVGTQRVEDELRMLLPDDVEVIRMDADTTREKGAHQRLLESFDAAPKAVLVGTQMIAKGLDFPEVTLVGVINADTTLKLPDFRAAERTYDLLEQVAGRAGRGRRAGKVIIQTYWASHPAIRAVAEHDRDVFLASELADREEAFYPPFSRLSNVLVWGRDERRVELVAAEMGNVVREHVADLVGWRVLGPAECLKARVKDRSRRHLLVKSPLGAEVGRLLSECARECAGRVGEARLGCNMALDIDAHDLM